METIKTIGVLVVLLVVGYLGYKAVTTPPPSSPRDDDGSPPATTNLNMPIPELPAELARQSKGSGSAAGQSKEDSAAQLGSSTTVAVQLPAASMSVGNRLPGGDPAASPSSQPGPGVGNTLQNGSALASLPAQPAVASAMNPSPGSASSSLNAGSILGVSPSGANTAELSSAAGSDAASSATETSNASENTNFPQRGVRKEFAEFLEAAFRKLDSGEFSQVHTVLSAWYADPRLTREEDAQLTDLLDQVAGTVVYSRQHLLEAPYIVQPGDTLANIAERYGVTPELLAKINGVARPELIAPGTTLKVVRGPFDAVIYMKRRELVLTLQGKYAGRFRIGIGKDAQNCEGTYQVREKTRNPRYVTDTVVYEPGDPRNPLGPLWIGLEGRLGIYGTNNPGQFDNPEAPGAIVVSAKDMEDLFDILTVGSRVMILP